MTALRAFPTLLLYFGTNSMRPDRIPLFPLNVVLLPGADLPLHIFEPRYRKMVRDCLDHKSEFGMLLALPDGIAGTGCTAEILEVVKTYDDGRIDILTVGRAPFRVVQLYTEDPLLHGNVDYLEDRHARNSPQTQKSLVEIYEACHTLIFGDYPRDAAQPEGQEQLSYTIASKLPMDLLWKQRILELRTEAERQERLLAYLRDWAPHLQKVQTEHRRAAGSGSGLN
jgi:Lon protease-like protein